ncbi:hypothetical protein ACIRVF_24965 [Kitasatospora sp. NPDC101157]|uniref:hypothetical protein n=1 Tax=Kitasatospora sp. NPDC101157 TaxID=3364098 RepID=UPI00380E2CBF
MPPLRRVVDHATTADARLYVWATNVNVRACAGTSASCPPIEGAQIGRRWVTAFCQRQSTEVVDGPYRNDWWVQVDAGGPVGWISAVYVRGGDNDQPVPGLSLESDCH